MFRKSLTLMRALAAAVWTAMDDRNLSLIAAGVAFYGLFAVFPGMAAVIAFWGYFSDPAAIPGFLEAAAEFIPPEAFGILESQLTALAASHETGLGWTSILSLLVALYFASAGVGALIQGLNAIHVRPQRGGLRRYIIALAMTLALIGVVMTALATVIFVPLALALLPLGALTSWIVGILPGFVTFLMVLVTLALFYRFGPNQPLSQGPWVAPGTVLAAALWAGASLGFSIYLSYFNTYNQIYGSIGAVVALLMWFYISAYTVLLGAAVNAEIARILSRDQ